MAPAPPVLATSTALKSGVVDMERTEDPWRGLVLLEWMENAEVTSTAAKRQARTAILSRTTILTLVWTSIACQRDTLSLFCKCNTAVIKKYSKVAYTQLLQEIPPHKMESQQQTGRRNHQKIRTQKNTKHLFEPSVSFNERFMMDRMILVIEEI